MIERCWGFLGWYLRFCVDRGQLWRREALVAVVIWAVKKLGVIGMLGCGGCILLFVWLGVFLLCGI